MTREDPSENQYTEAHYKTYQRKVTIATIGFLDVLAKVAEEMPVPFGDTKCRFLPDDGLPKEDLLPRLSKTLRPLMGHMRAILDEMNAGAFKIDNSTPLAGVIRVCTEYGVTPYQGNYFAQRLDVIVPDAIARGCDTRDASLR
ncbi:hypothetical protein AAVH_24786 [Aphelenchoides avenae]|nr:hypothetical protein AAVH_24786 [Aphelenchus avenae]